MTPIVKDPENAASPTAPGIPATPVANAPARPQPVALEVPVTVNGARSMDGSDKREPFSERSQTVLVFGHGAVLRISAQLAPGQLVFLTNEKTKKEVVCVVVKSKTDGNAVGYVELRFTEPAPGFWGMRFPSDTVLPQAATRPAAPASAPVAPKAPPVATPVAAKPPAPAAPIAPKPAVAPPPAPVSVTPETPKVPAPAPPPVASPVALPVARVAEPAVSSVGSSALFAPADSKTVLSAPAVAPPTSASQSTDELKQQAARLQEQLSSLLFAETPKPGMSIPAAAPENPIVPELAQKVLDLSNTSPEPVPSQSMKSVPALPKPHSSSLEVEEIKIPSWLAPLARESETPAVEQSIATESHLFTEVEPVVAQPAEDLPSVEAQESTRRPEVAIFGGQLLGESSQSAEPAPSGSKMALFLGIAASLLLVAGGVWYSRQPGNAISGMFGGSSTASQPAASTAAEPQPSLAKPVSRLEIPTAAASSAPAPVLPPAVVPSAAVKNAPVAPASRNTNLIATPSTSPTSSPRNASSDEEPKKPALGDVRLATPVIGRRKTAAAPGDSAPTIDVNATDTAAPIVPLNASHGSVPAAPVPVGGDVKPAKLLKSVQPIYPQMARTQHVSGNVQIDALIDAEGNVSSMNVLSGPALLRDAALQSLKQWKYQPAELDGKPTSMHLTVVLQFRTQ